jgi:hypothetical protein
LNFVIRITPHQAAATAVITCNQHVTLWSAAYATPDILSAFLDIGQDVNATSSMHVLI